MMCLASASSPCQLKTWFPSTAIAMVPIVPFHWPTYAQRLVATNTDNDGLNTGNDGRWHGRIRRSVNDRNTLRGAMILDVPVPGVAGWDQSIQGLWHIGFIQTPGQFAEKLVDGREAVFLGWCYDQGKFSPAERAYYVKRYGAPQIHSGGRGRGD
jgi:hypothetical protein